MAYIINDSRGQIVAIIPDGTIDTTSTPLQLVGRGVTEYGVPENENYVFILENFAKDTAPVNPLQGQLWFNTANNVISVRSNVNTWLSLSSQDYVQAQKISPVFTGVPEAPTANTGTNTNQLATTAFVQNNKVSPVFTGTPLAPTPARGATTNQIATAEFVTNSVLLQGVPEATTAAFGTNTNQIATTAFVQGEKDSPTFTGVPQAPTAPRGTSNNQIATTAFVSESPIFNGVPEAPTAPPGTGNTQIATTGFVTNNVQLQGVPTATTAPPGTANTQIATTAFVANSVQLFGTPTAPTPGPNDNTTKIATTQFVQAQKANIVLTGFPLAPTPDGLILNQIATVLYVNSSIANIDLTIKANVASPVLTGIPQAPTPVDSTNSDQIATTRFVKNVAASDYNLWQGSHRFISTSDPNPSTGVNGDFWFKYQP
jgi:hypothetical protein